ncbi:2430_t:CDS:2 [Funneliformis caledonium]|uniref:2430_t:CDS:1 n=1 Tax=Funneliformis caledonium TaxID=1117310 RepID=A0A9N8V7K0_9GLOM|nr:2430_t:CDS:2 [Funneliformis caledonium]
MLEVNDYRVNDYRVSRIVILCKDCGQDVGLYPARHKCGIPSSEAPPLPSIPNQYLSTKSGTQSNNDTHSDGIWNKLRSVRSWKDTESKRDEHFEVDNSQSSKIWKTLLNVTSYTNDDESEKDGWEGETHISRILREYYEEKGEYLPDWLHDSNSNSDNKNSTQVSSKENNYSPPMITNLNDNKNKNSNRLQTIDNDINKNLQPKNYNQDLSTSPSSMNFHSSHMNKRNRERSRDYIMDKNKVIRRYDDRNMKQHINNTLPSKGWQPSPNARSSDDKGRLMTKKSHNQLRTGSDRQLHNDVPHIPTNRSKVMNSNFFPSNPQQQHQPFPHNGKGLSYGGNKYEGDFRGRQGVQLSGSRGPNRNRKMSTTTADIPTNITNSVTSLTTKATATDTTTRPDIRPCCACPETKRNRDQCIFETGDEEKCKDLIEAHKACMRSFGFNV